jgi:alpha-1,3-mannosyltransferase
MLLIQVVLATPFLLVEPYNYMRLAFDFGRAFFYVWTVNLKILDEQTFLSPALAKGLLGAHLVLLVLFVHKMLAGGIVTFVVDMLRGAFVPSCTPPASVSAVVANVPKAVKKATRPSHAYIVTLLFVTNFVGIVCARSLHYQFYVWYYHTLPLLLWLTPLPTVLRLSLLAAIEYAWNVFPATAQSSGVLIAAHVVLTLALLFSKRLPPPPSTTPIELQQPQQQSKKVQ